MEFLILIAGAVALVWGGVLLRKGGILGGSLAVLLAGICFGHPFFNVPLGPFPLTIDRLLFVGLLAVAIAYRCVGWTHARKMTGSDWALAAFLLVLLTSTLSHDWQVNRFQPLAQVVFFFLMPVAMYWIIRQAPISDQALDAMYLALGLFGIYLALTSLAEVRQMWAFVFPRYISSTTYAEFFGRGRGPLLNPAGSGILQGLCMLGMMMRWPRASRMGQMLILGLMPLYALGIYSTFTRSAWLGLALGVVIVLGLTLPRIWCTAVIGTLIVAAVPTVAFNWERLLSFKRDKALSAGRGGRIGQITPHPGRRRLAHVFGSPAARLRLWPVRHRKPGLSVRSLGRLAAGKGPAVCPAQFVSGLAGRYRPGRDGLVLVNPLVVAADGLAVVAQLGRDAVGATARLAVYGIRRRLASQRDVPGRADHPDGQHAAGLLGRRGRESRKRGPRPRNRRGVGRFADGIALERRTAGANPLGQP